MSLLRIVARRSQCHDSRAAQMPSSQRPLPSSPRARFFRCSSISRGEAINEYERALGSARTPPHQYWVGIFYA